MEKAAKVPVGADIVESVIVHSDVGHVGGHTAERSLSADLEHRFIAGGVVLEDGGAVDESFSPLGPTPGCVFTFNSENRSAVRLLPAFLEGEDFRGGGLENFLAAASRLFGVRVVSFLIIKSESAQVESSVEVDDIAGAEGEVSSADGFGGETDIFGFSPTFLRDEAFADEFVVFILHTGCHVSRHHTGAKLDDLNAVGGESGGPELCSHGEAGLGDTVFTAVNGGGIGGDRGYED